MKDDFNLPGLHNSGVVSRFGDDDKPMTLTGSRDTGKTGSLKDIAAEAFANASNVIHIDASKGGMDDLALKIAQNPKAVIIFDEIEKAPVSKDTLKKIYDLLDAGTFELVEPPPPPLRPPGGIAASSGDDLRAQREREIEQTAYDATVLQNPMTVGKPLSFRNRFSFI